MAFFPSVFLFMVKSTMTKRNMEHLGAWWLPRLTLASEKWHWIFCARTEHGGLFYVHVTVTRRAHSSGGCWVDDWRDFGIKNSRNRKDTMTRTGHSAHLRSSVTKSLQSTHHRFKPGLQHPTCPSVYYITQPVALHIDDFLFKEILPDNENTGSLLFSPIVPPFCIPSPHPPKLIAWTPCDHLTQSGGSNREWEASKITFTVHFPLSLP